jgi:hypothetical protein
MKNYIALVLLFSIAIASCGDKSTPNGYSKKPPAKRTIFDTTRVIGVFVTPSRDNIVHDIMFKVRFDSAQKMVEGEKGVFKQLWYTDSAYFLPKVITIIDTATHKPVLDSLGNPKFRTDWVGPYTSELVWDSGINVDSAQKRFKGFLVADTVKKK